MTPEGVYKIGYDWTWPTIDTADFTFERDGRRAHLEIIGFWQRDYLQRRIELLRDYGPGNLVLAVSKSLGGGKGAVDLPVEVVPFAKIVPPKAVIEAVERVAQ